MEGFLSYIEGEKLKKTGYFLLLVVFAFSMSLLIFNNSFAEGAGLKNNDAEITAEKSILTAEDELQEQEKFRQLREKSHENSKLFSPVKVFSKLIALILILLLIVVLYNKYGKEALSKAMVIKKIKHNAINILSSSSIGQGKYLHIVEVDGEKILIGATANNITFLKDLKNTKREKVISDEQNN